MKMINTRERVGSGTVTAEIRQARNGLDDMRKPVLAILRCSSAGALPPKLPARAEAVGQDHFSVHRMLITVIIDQTRSGLIEVDPW
jgi:hypothetical protein